MKSSAIAKLRLLNQHIAPPQFEQPADVVAWLGAVQAQDYLGALWAVGLRTKQAHEADIEQAIADRAIIRTWPMRGTLHFVTPSDVRWMLKLLTPRVIASNTGRQLKQNNIDEATIAHSKELLANALQGGKRLTRDEMYKVLEAGRVSTTDQRGLQILWRVAQEGLICFGSRKGKQPTFVLFEEWVPEAKLLDRDEALAELATRYMVSHGPATLQDLVWWSGLTIADAKAGLEMAKPQLAQEVIDEQTYWFAPTTLTTDNAARTVYLLPNFDEYVVGYRNRDLVFDPAHAKLVTTNTGIFTSAIIWEGRVVGTWKRTFVKGSVVITPNPFEPLPKPASKAFVAATKRYGEFVGSPVSIV